MLSTNLILFSSSSFSSSMLFFTILGLFSSMLLLSPRCCLTNYLQDAWSWASSRDESTTTQCAPQCWNLGPSVFDHCLVNGESGDPA